MVKKILIISTVGLGHDGITNVLLSYLEAIDKEGMDLYVVSTIRSEDEIRKRIEELGVSIVDMSSRRTNPVKYFVELTSFIRGKGIDVIHVHGNSGTMAIEMLAGWLGGAKKRIAHSHNTKCDQIKMDKVLRPLFNFYYTDAVACGKAAGKWLFGKKSFVVLNNGRNVKQFSFNEEIREYMRMKLAIGDRIAVGHVGNFCEQKNHEFLIEIFREILKIKPTAKLYLIGKGPLEDKIRNESRDLGSSVVFVGTTMKVADYLQAMDVMVLPSLFEGLPLVAVEWQINGLQCYLSSNITKECKFTDFVHFMDLSLCANEWAQKIIADIDKDKRKANSDNAIIQIKKAGFDINSSALELRKLYLR